MTIRDRGKIKFMPALLPPELRAMLREAEEAENDVGMPLLDEQQLDHFNQVICESMEYVLAVKVIYYSNKRHKKAYGKIHYIDPIKKAIRIVDQSHDWFEIKIENIIDISIHNE